MSPAVKGFVAAMTVVCVWSGFVVFSRHGILHGLTFADVGLLRYTTAGLLVLPFAWHWWPRRLPWQTALKLGIVGPGVAYGLLSYAGLVLVPASYGGVFSNGSLPIFTVIFGVLFANQTIGWRSLIAIGLIVLGGLILGLFGDAVPAGDAWLGALLLLGGSAVLSMYLIGAKTHNIRPTEALAIINIPNMVLIWMIWPLFDSTLSTASWTVILMQMAFQGIAPSILAVVCYAIMIQHFGSAITAGISAIVPITATLLAIPVLSEWPSLMQWVGVVVATGGLALLLIRRAAR